MYPSGQWDGFWEQAGFGRQQMTPFFLRFEGATITGEGKDIVGRFVLHGQCDAKNGRVRIVKQYVGKHRVMYEGEPDGEGCVFGTWRIEDLYSGPFLLRPMRVSEADEEMREIV